MFMDGASLMVIFIASLLPLYSADTRESEALLRIKDRLAGQSNPFFSTWINGSDPCFWEGVNCTNGRVTALNLTGKGLAGDFPGELGSLILLETLELRNNSIRGPIPGSFASLLNLKILELSRNPLFGDFPNVLLEIKSLVDIRLGNCNLTGPFPNIQELPSLLKLYLNNNNLEGGLPELSNLPLVELSIWGTKLDSEWKAFGALTNLEFLSLHSCGLEGALPVEWGESLRKLETIFLNNNNLTGSIPDSWSQMNKLKALRLDMNKLSGSIPSWVPALNPINVSLYCNFFSGKAPEGYPATNIKGNCFQNLKDHGRECSDGLGCQHTSTNNRKMMRVFLTIGGGLCAALVLISIGAALWKYRHTEDKKQQTGDLKNWESPAGLEKFSLNQLTKATKGFSEQCKLGGKVYRGRLPDGRVIAVKEVDVKDGRGFLNEVAILSRLRHRNIVPLVGFCHREKHHQILVYEYMENGNLQQWLLGKCEHLDWYKRLQIAIGVSQGLEYLHSLAVVHGNLKLSNILLDGSLTPKVLYFGISSKLETHNSTNTDGYLDPEFFIMRQLSTASDVYSFGVVLLELVTGQKAIDHTRLEESNLVEWVKPNLASEGVSAVVDNRLGEDYPEAIFQVLIMLAMKCAAFHRTKRPTMKTVLDTLTSLNNKWSR